SSVSSSSSQTNTTTQTIINGWNLLSLPIDTTLNQTEFNSKYTNIVTMWKWTGTSWNAYSPNASLSQKIANAGISALSSITTGDGYWLNTTQNQNVTFSGNSYNIKTLSKFTTATTGWHLLGTGESVTVNELTALKSNIVTIWKWSGTSWSAYGPNSTLATKISNAGINTLNTINAGDGFWVNLQ
ncbi:MAG: hypothetical protein HXX81_03110, partial [Campylobacterales bacterium]|nr:hypothetical protein [Campylobacterales bacterium]